jgi:hypothetical protein
VSVNQLLNWAHAGQIISESAGGIQAQEVRSNPRIPGVLNFFPLWVHHLENLPRNRYARI